MPQERLSATLSIGSVLEGSVRRNVSVLRSGLDSVGKSISEVARRQKELERNRKVLEREGRSVAELDREYQDLGRTLDALRRKQQRLEAVSAGVGRVGRDMRAVGRDMRNLSVGALAAAGAASTAIFGIAASTATLGDNVAKTAGRLGIGIEELQELRYAAERSGVSVATLDMATQRMVRRIAEAAAGKGEAKDALIELGLEAEKLRDAGPAAAFDEIADALARVESPADRVRLAMKLFDSEGVALVNMLKDGSEGLQQLRRDARATGYVLSEQAARDAETFQDRLMDTQLVLQGLKNTVGAALLPVVSDAMSRFSGWAVTNKAEIAEWAAAFAGGLEDLLPKAAAFLGDLRDVTGAVRDGVSSVAEWVGGWRNLGIAVAVAVGAGPIGRIARLIGSVGRLGFAIGRLALAPPLFSAATKTMAAAAAADFARTATAAELSASRMSAARNRMMGKAGVGAVLGGLAMSQAPSDLEELGAWQQRNREGMEATFRATPILGSLMEAYDAALAWRTGADQAAEGNRAVEESSEDAAAALSATPAAGEAFAAGMVTVRSAAAETETVLLRSASAVDAINRKFAEMEAASKSAHLTAADISALGAAHGSSTGPSPSASAGRIQARAGGGSFQAGPLLVGERGPEAMWASRGGYVSSVRELEGLRALARRTFSDLSRAGGGGPAPAPAGPMTVIIQGAGQMAGDIVAELERRTRSRGRRRLFDGPAGLGQYGAA